MQEKIWTWTSLIITLATILKIAIPEISSESQAVTQIESTSLDHEIAEHILLTSIQITMMEYVFEKIETEAIETDQDEIWQKVEKTTNGLGTLVSYQGEILLISHDHWSLFTSSTAPDKVAFRDAKGSLLLEMAGSELLPLILFHDSGTFIIKAPKELRDRTMITADMGFFEALNPGDIVHVVHHSPVHEGHISIMAAEIIGHEMNNGVPMLSLRSLNGQSIEPGDSGGGIWVNGRLAGNMWMTMREVRQYWWQLKPSNNNETAFSLAAGLPVDLNELMETLLQVESLPILETDGLS